MIKYVCKYLLLSLVIVFLLGGCAQIVAPSGGPKDDIPPKVLSMVPENYSTNFGSGKIVITFDEYVSIKNTRDQVIISPPLQTWPDFSIQKKSLIIRLMDPLMANTTYTINLGEAVKDITEGNPLTDNMIVFSTGDYIDSAAVSGNVTNAFDLKSAENATVMLYQSTSDSVPMKEKPNYFSRTDKDGNFEIKNIKPGPYKLFVLKEENKNFIYDAPSESVAFVDSLIFIDTTRLDLHLNLFQELPKEHRISSWSFSHPGRLLIMLNKPCNSVSVENIKPEDDSWNYTEFSRRKDTITYWNNGSKSGDTLTVIVRVNGDILDTLDLTYELKKNEEGKRIPLGLKSNVVPLRLFNLYDDLVIQGGFPVEKIDTSGWVFVEAADTVLFESVIIDHPSKVIIKRKWKEGADYKVMIPQGAFTDYFGNKNDTNLIMFKSQISDHYGILKLSFNLGERDEKIPMIVQLLNESDKEYKRFRITQDTIIQLNHALPSKYKLKAIFDANGNGEWDTGNYLEGIQPERVIYDSQIIELRSNWEVDVEWEIPSLDQHD